MSEGETMIVDWNRRGARRASSVMMKSAGPVAAALVLAVASPARAQISVGAIVPVAAQASVGGILPGPVQGSDSAYDPAHGVFLVVSHCYVNCSFSPYGAIFGIFVNPAGTPVTAPFAISASPNGWFPHVRYAQALNAGAGGFLVAWAEEGGGGHSVVKVATISYPGLIVSPPNTISDATSYTSIITGPALGYSPVNQRFLVAWATNALNAIAPTAPPVVGRLVDLMGNPLTSVFAVSGLSAHDPNVTWNSTNNVFGVSFIAESCPACSSAPIFAGFAQVSPVDASLIRQSFNQISGQMKVTDIDYNPDTNHYVMVWWQGVSGSPVTETRAAEIDTGANVVAAGLLSNSFAYLLSTAFNPISRTFLMAGVLASDRVGAIELNGHGLPLSLTTALTVTTPATVGRSARVASSTAGPLWNVNYVDSYTSVKNLAVTTATTGGGAPGSLGAPPAVPPPSGTPLPPPPGGCTTSDPFVSLGGGTCVNGNWLPPGSGAPSTGECPSTQPGPSWICSNGNWLPPSGGGTGGCITPDPFTTIGGGVCINGNWLPGGPGGYEHRRIQ